MAWRSPARGVLPFDAAPFSGDGPGAAGGGVWQSALGVGAYTSPVICWQSSTSPTGVEPGSRVAATEVARVAVDGAPVVPAPGPALPAEATMTVPASAALLAARALVPAGSPCVSPSERLMTSATGLATGVGPVSPLAT